MLPDIDYCLKLRACLSCSHHSSIGLGGSATSLGEQVQGMCLTKKYFIVGKVLGVLAVREVLNTRFSEVVVTRAVFYDTDSFDSTVSAIPEH